MNVLEKGKKTLLYRGWAHALLLTGLLVWEVASCQRRRPKLLALEAGGLAHLALFFFVAPVCDFRFLLWPVVATMVAVGIALSERDFTGGLRSRGRFSEAATTMRILVARLRPTRPT